MPRLNFRRRWNATHLWLGVLLFVIHHGFNSLTSLMICHSLCSRTPLVCFPCQTIKIWVRNYQILEQTPRTAKEAQNQRKLTGQPSSTSLIDTGPRFVLDQIRIFRGSFGGQTLYGNVDFVNPNIVRSLEKREKGDRYVKRKGAEKKRKRYEEELTAVVPVGPLRDVFRWSWRKV